MNRRQFRFSYFTSDYDATVAFYRDGLALPIEESWDRGAEEKGTLFAAASGFVEVLLRPASDDAEGVFDPRPPQGAFMVIEVEDVDAEYRRAVRNGVPVRKELSRQSWGHLSFCVTEPNGLTVYVFAPE